MYGYTTEYLETLPTIEQGQDANLKVKEDGRKVWLSRLTREDGAEYDHEVTVEVLQDGRWVTACRYSGDHWYELIDTWDGGSGNPTVVWTGCTPDGAIVWVLSHTPFSYREATTHQGYVLRKFR